MAKPMFLGALLACLAGGPVFHGVAVAEPDAASLQTVDGVADIHAELLEYYGKRAGYRQVKRDVLRWHKTTKNGCVAFVSTALRHVGYDVPLRGMRDGYGISRITFAFSDFLLDAGWSEIRDAKELAPGDIVFTVGFPDHVFVFHSWSKQSELVARVIDNVGYLKRRPLVTKSSSRFSAFAYALRLEPDDRKTSIKRDPVRGRSRQPSR